MTPRQASSHTCKRVGDLDPLINAALLPGISSSTHYFCFFHIFRLGAFALRRSEPFKGLFDAFCVSAALILLSASFQVLLQQTGMMLLFSAAAANPDKQSQLELQRIQRVSA